MNKKLLALFLSVLIVAQLLSCRPFLAADSASYYYNVEEIKSPYNDTDDYGHFVSNAPWDVTSTSLDTSRGEAAIRVTSKSSDGYVCSAQWTGLNIQNLSMSVNDYTGAIVYLKTTNVQKMSFCPSDTHATNIKIYNLNSGASWQDVSSQSQDTTNWRCWFVIPENFEGFIYVPFSSAVNAGKSIISNLLIGMYSVGGTYGDVFTGKLYGVTSVPTNDPETAGIIKLSDRGREDVLTANDRKIETTINVEGAYADSAVPVNPDRGFQSQAILNVANLQQTNKDGGVTLAASETEDAIFDNIRANYREMQSRGSSLMKVYVYLCGYNYKEIDSAGLSRIQRMFDYARENKFKIIFRPVYRHSYDDYYGNGSAPQSTILSHLEQLKPILEANKDVIYCFEAGLLGTVGEWWDANQNNSWMIVKYDLGKVLKAFLDIIPEGIYMNVRQPKYRDDLKDTTLYNRIGFFNDAVFGNRVVNKGEDTIVPGQSGWQIITDESHLVPSGGEMYWGEWLYAEGSDGAYRADDPTQREWVDGFEFIEQAVQHHFAYFSQTNNNYGYNGMVFSMDKWRETQITPKWCENNDVLYQPEFFKDRNGNAHSRNIYEFVKEHIGYRIAINELEVSGMAIPNEKVDISFTLQNFGFSRPYNLESGIVLIDNDGSIVSEQKIGNPNDWQPWTTRGTADEYSFSTSFKFPNVSGNYKIGFYIRNSAGHNVTLANRLTVCNGYNILANIHVSDKEVLSNENVLLNTVLSPSADAVSYLSFVPSAPWNDVYNSQETINGISYMKYTSGQAEGFVTSSKWVGASFQDLNLSTETYTGAAIYVKTTNIQKICFLIDGTHGKSACLYDENNKNWLQVTQSIQDTTNWRYWLDIPAGYEGYIYVPFDSAKAEGKNQINYITMGIYSVGGNYGDVYIGNVYATRDTVVTGVTSLITISDGDMLNLINIKTPELNYGDYGSFASGEPWHNTAVRLIEENGKTFAEEHSTSNNEVICGTHWVGLNILNINVTTKAFNGFVLYLKTDNVIKMAFCPGDTHATRIKLIDICAPQNGWQTVKAEDTDMSNWRNWFTIPKGFEGYVYIPFESVTAASKETVSNLLIGTYAVGGDYGTVKYGELCCTDIEPTVTSRIPIPYDMNSDFKIDIRDLVFLKKQITTLSSNTAFDVNKDGNVNSFDLTLLRKCLLGVE